MMYLGIDWSSKKHDCAFMNEKGSVIAKSVISAKLEGFLEMDSVRQKLGVAPGECLVALETAHNLIIDFLWSRGYDQVYVVPPSVVKSTRGRYGQSGARTDESDAMLLADLLRTDLERLHPWKPDSLLTRQLRADISLWMYWTKSQTRLTNRLRAVLQRYYPASLEVFSSLAALIALEFIRKYPTPQDAAELSWPDFQDFAKKHRYTRRKQLPARFATLQAVSPVASPETVEIYKNEAVWLVEQLLHIIQHRKDLKERIKQRFSQHPDQHIFSSLPGTGDFLAPALLVKFGDDRKRFPSPSSIQALAGTCPVTKSSGKRRYVKFRRSCDKQFRNIAQQFAIASLRDSIWANTYFQNCRPTCSSGSHAYRCLANRWLNIIWKLWQSNQPYDEDYHLKQRELHSKPRSFS